MPFFDTKDHLMSLLAREKRDLTFAENDLREAEEVLAAAWLKRDNRKSCVAEIKSRINFLQEQLDGVTR